MRMFFSFPRSLREFPSVPVSDKKPLLKGSWAGEETGGLGSSGVPGIRGY